MADFGRYARFMSSNVEVVEPTAISMARLANVP
jgi:hypothetical protein